VQQSITTNTLFYGDNLAIIREYIPDESVDLVYLQQRIAMTLTRMHSKTHVSLWLRSVIRGSEAQPSDDYQFCSW
jgi:hypothetical protein